MLCFTVVHVKAKCQKVRVGATMAVPIKMMACVDEIIQYTDDVYQVTFTPEKKNATF